MSPKIFGRCKATGTAVIDGERLVKQLGIDVEIADGGVYLVDVQLDAA